MIINYCCFFYSLYFGIFFVLVDLRNENFYYIFCLKFLMGLLYINLYGIYKILVFSILFYIYVFLNLERVKLSMRYGGKVYV